MYMEIRNSKTEMPLFKVKGEKFIFVGEKTIMKLSDMCIMFGDGDWIESKDQSDDGIRLLQTGNIGEGKFLEKEGKERFISRETFEKLKCKEVFSGDILISRLPEPVGRACLVPEKKQRMITAVDCTICRIDDKKIRRRYLCYYLQSANYYTQLKNSITGTTRKRISRKNLGNIEIKIPSDKKQEEVIKQLDLIVEIIDNKKKKLQLLDTLVKSRFAEMFGNPLNGTAKYPIHQVGEVANSVDPQPSHRTPPVEEDGVPYVSIKDCDYKTGKIDFEGARKVSPKVLEEHLNRYTLHEGDFVIGKIGTIGNPVFIPARDDYTLSANIVLVQPNRELVSPYFLKYSFESDFVERQFAEAKNSTSQAAFGIQKVRTVKVMNPDLDVQNKFENFVQQVDKSKSKIQKSLEETQLLFDSLMQKYFG